jgi:integrase
MANRTTYRDHGLVFAQEPADCRVRGDRPGGPLRLDNPGTGEFARLLKVAEVRRITLHGLRHTSATLLLQQGIPAKVVSERLGHANISITLDTYSHVLPTMGRAAATALAEALHG